MAEVENNSTGGEQVQGAPPALSRAEARERRLTQTITVNRYLSKQIQQLDLMLLQANDLFSLFEILLVSLPRHFDLRVSELWLHDPENILSDLLSGAHRYGHHLQLFEDAFSMQELYDIEPDIQVIDATDSRMFEILKSDHGIDHCILIPLMSSGRLIGSFHCGAPEFAFTMGEAEEDLMAHLGTVISTCLENSVSRQLVNQLTMLDPLTHISNPRGFEAAMTREVSRAQRLEEPVSVVMMEIDEYDDLLEHYGEVRSHFVLKKVAERISSDLRATDTMARFSGSCMAVVVPGCGEVLGQEIAERMRMDVEGFAVDDGRGAILHVSLSMGIVTWEPQYYRAIDMRQLALQMESGAKQALEKSQQAGGNQTSMARLNAPLV